MLAVVLLHVVEAARAVHPAMDAVVGDRRVEDVQDLALLLDHRHDARAVEGARVPRLAAALGVERGAVEHHRRAVAVSSPGDDGGVELEPVRVVPVQALGHQSGASVSTYL